VSTQAAQIRAAEPAASVWVSANAGTGKTRVLIDRIVRLLVAGTPPERILCLTFTKAAATEMATRLDDRLGQWSVAEDARIATDLAASLGRSPAPEEIASARRLFARVLDAADGPKIQTIHAFCESLLARFPLEARIAPHFQVADEYTATALRLEARDRTLTASLADDGDALARAVRHLASTVDEGRLADLIVELTGRYGRLEAALARSGGPEGLIATARQAHDLTSDDTRHTLLAAASEDAAFDGAGLAAACGALDQGSDADRDRARRIRAWLADPDGRADGMTGDYAAVFLTKTGEPRADSTLATKKARAAVPDPWPALQAERSRIAALAERLKACEVIDNTAALLTFAAAQVETYRRLKAERGLLDFDDLIGHADALMAADGGASWVHFKLDGGLDHILVDEAQDTSPEQWSVIRALAAEFFAGEGARDVPRTVFAVGDEKQSIYSFQGADPDAFTRMRDHFAVRVEAAGGDWRPVELAVSYRSTVPVLQAVDAVFGPEAARAGLGTDGPPIRHVPHRQGQAGLVEVWPTIKPEAVPDSDPWDAPVDAMAPHGPERRLAEDIAARIDDWLRSGEMLESQARPIRPEDILILVRTRGRFAAEMVRCLKARGVPVAGSDRMVLTEQMAVMDMMALGRFAVLPEDDLTLAVVLKSPFVGFDDDQLFELAHGRNDHLWATLRRRRDERPAFATAYEWLAKILERADFAPPFEFFSAALGPDGGRQALLRRLGTEAADPIDEFLALALGYEREHVPSLQGFLHWVETGGTEVKRDMEQGAGEVRVMTVHGAKGLQANVVILPDTCSLPSAQLGPHVLWGSGDDEGAASLILWPGSKDSRTALCERLREAARARTEDEYRRLLYVAMTRSRDRLYVGGWESVRGRTDGCWYDLVTAGLRTIPDLVVEATLKGAPAEGQDETILRLASPQTAAPEGKPEAPVPTVTAALPAWALSPPPAEADPPRPLAPSRPDEEAPPVRSPVGADDGDRFRRGRLVHRLLQILPDVTPARRGDTARAWLARPIHGLAPADRESLSAEVLAVLEHPLFAGLFGAAGRAEVAVTGVVGGRVVFGQIDHLLVTDSAVTIVDFKTGREPPTDPGAVPQAYLRQMAAYRALMRDIYPDRSVRCALLWTDTPAWMDLPDSLLDGAAP